MDDNKNLNKKDRELEELIKIADSIDIHEFIDDLKNKENITVFEDENKDQSIDFEELEIELKPASSLSIESKDGLNIVLDFLKKMPTTPDRDESIEIIKKIMDEES